MCSTLVFGLNSAVIGWDDILSTAAGKLEHIMQVWRSVTPQQKCLVFPSRGQMRRAAGILV
jgi:hypothetical protein